MLPFLVLMAVAYVAAAPDSRTHAASRGTAGAGRAAAVGAYRQVRGDWQSGRPNRQKAYRKWRTRLADSTWGSGLLVGWDVLRFAGRGTRAASRSGYRAGKAAYRSGRSAYRPAAERAQRKRVERRERRVAKRLGMEPGADEQLAQNVEIPGDNRLEPDPYKLVTRASPDGSTRGDLFYSGAPELGDQHLATFTKPTAREAQAYGAEIAEELQRKHGRGAPAQMAAIPLDAEGNPPSPYGAAPADPWQDPPLITDTIRPAHWKPVPDPCAVPRHPVRDGMAWIVVGKTRSHCSECFANVVGYTDAEMCSGCGAYFIGIRAVYPEHIDAIRAARPDMAVRLDNDPNGAGDIWQDPPVTRTSGGDEQPQRSRCSRCGHTTSGVVYRGDEVICPRCRRPEDDDFRGECHGTVQAMVRTTTAGPYWIGPDGVPTRSFDAGPLVQSEVRCSNTATGPDGMCDEHRKPPHQPAGISPVGTTTPPAPEGTTDMQMSIKPTELTDTSALRGEAKEARQAFEELRDALDHVKKYLTGLGDRYAGAPFGTEKLSRSVTALTEHASGVDPAAVDALLSDVTALEEALTEAESLGEHASSVKAEGQMESFQPA